MSIHPSAVVLLTAAVLAPGALAHDDAARPQPPAFDAARVEATPFGRQGDPKRVARTIRIEMADTMRFTPAELTVRAGETVRFVAANTGKVLHEMVLGTPEALAEHAALMRKFPGMAHDEPHMTHVKPGARGEIVWQFTRPGRFQFACLIPGHFEAGMVGTIVVR